MESGDGAPALRVVPHSKANPCPPAIGCVKMAANHAPISPRNWPVFMRVFGRNLQRLGLLLPPVAIVLELSERIRLGQMLALLAFSVCLFGIGRILEGYGKN